MPTVTKRDLNQHTASVLQQVTGTSDVVVTEHGRPRWRVSADREEEAPLARMERRGLYAPPSSSPAPWPECPSGPVRAEAQVEALLDEMKGDH